MTRLLAVLCGLALLAVGGWGWAHRQDLKRWLLWWEVRRLAALREKDPEAQAFQPTENRGLSPFEVAFSRLVKLQRPEFRGAQDLSFFRIRGRHGKNVLAAVYEPMQNDFESPVGEVEVINVVFCGCEFVQIRLLDGSGNLLHEPVWETVWHNEPIRIVSRGSYDVLRLRSDIWCMACRDTLQGYPWKELSVDAAGLLDHGLIASDVPGAPVCARSSRDERPAPMEIGELLASGLDGDAHRALTAIETGASEDADLIEPLLRHEEPLVRARAAVIANRVPELREDVLMLLDDSDPGVRAGAVIAARRYSAWEPAVLRVAQGEDAALARRARLELSHSEDPSYARPALLELLRDRERTAIYRDHGQLADGELADAMLDWLESSKDAPWDLATQLNTVYSREILIEKLDRLLSLFRRAAAEGRERTLIDLLIKLDDPRADDVVVKTLDSTRYANQVLNIVDALLARGTPVRADAATDVLVKLLREDRFDLCKDNVALLLMRHGRIEALGWVLRNLEIEEGEFFPMSQILGWISAANGDHRKPEPEVVLYPPFHHTNGY